MASAEPLSEGSRGRSRFSEQWQSEDPRASSMHSLRPDPVRDGRRILLLVYIHGFMGNETSFQSFPAHVHNLLAATTAETHVVHTKIYPRYKSRKAIEFARDDFSRWLEPHEGSHMDIVLLGHSMGGILSAEVVLLTPTTPVTRAPFRHRILGTISFDTPFLGMHPGIIMSGLSSLFRPAPDASQAGRADKETLRPEISASKSQTSLTADSTSSVRGASPSPLSPAASTMSALSEVLSDDPNYNPPFPNDVRMAQRSGWSNMLHFINKHSDGLTTATKQYLTSHIEFGGCLADFPGLRNRYNKIRALEDVDVTAPSHGSTSSRRVRFLNYYTASTGLPKKLKVPAQKKEDASHQVTNDLDNLEIAGSSDQRQECTQEDLVDLHATKNGIPPSPNQVFETPFQDAQMLQEVSTQRDAEHTRALQHIDSMPIEDEGDNEDNDDRSFTTAVDHEAIASEGDLQGLESQLPPLPTEPVKPADLDLTPYTDKDARKLAEKEHKRIMKAYLQAVKSRESALKDRKKLLEKRDKRARQEREKTEKAEKKEELARTKEDEKRKATINPPQDKHSMNNKTDDPKPTKDRRFCVLPGLVDGRRDKTWVRIYMEGVDEVGAHCGLFFPGPQYESLVGDVSARIEEWAKEDATMRLIVGDNEEDEYGEEVD